MGYTGDAKREYDRKWKQARRQEWLDENGPCVDCGGVENLEVDHQDATAKLLQPSALWGMSRTNPKRVAELAKCVVRCHECHTGKTKRHKEAARGEASGQAKQSDVFVDEFRQTYRNSQLSFNEISRRTGIPASTVRDWLRLTYRTEHAGVAQW